MKQFALYFIILANMGIFMSSMTFIFDPDFAEILGMEIMVVLPLMKAASVASFLSVIASFIIAYDFDKEDQRKRGF